MACRARTRPRISGAARVWTMAVDDTRNEIELSPSTTPTASAAGTLGASAITAMLAP